MFLRLILVFVFNMLFCNIMIAQQGTIEINQDAKITELLELKKQVNSEAKNNDTYKIQIFSGTRNGAQNARSKFYARYSRWPAKLVYQTPNYKIWIGNFRTRLEADRALKEIKSTFYSALIFKPKKEK